MAKKKASKKKPSKKTDKIDKGGRRETFTKEHKEVMLRLAPLGYTNDEMADIIGCVRSTFYKWLQEDSALSDALKIAKTLADSEVTQALFRKATGRVKVEEVTQGICPSTGNIIENKKIREIAPDTTSMIFWLKNRRPDEWREKQQVEHDVKEGVTLAYAIPDKDNQ